MRRLILVVVCVCLTASTAETAPRKRGPPPDPFKACDLQVREDLREGGTWLIPQAVQIDEARLTISVTFPSGQSIKSVPRFLRGKTDEEKRRQLRAYLDEMNAAVDGCKKGASVVHRRIQADAFAGDAQVRGREYQSMVRRPAG